MPFGKRNKKTGSLIVIQVVNTETGRIMGTHVTTASADKQLAALHAKKADKE